MAVATGAGTAIEPDGFDPIALAEAFGAQDEAMVKAVGAGQKPARGKAKAAEAAKPLAFIGKGVTFDTGGISIKPAAGMEDMKGDMGGAACVAGLMMALAKRKAKVNAVGAIGLVENMPDGKAQRPGDVVTSMSGQTIAVLNTDAEGRLVLADVLWYIQDRFKPRFMIDLATLTGAILVALGKEHAGLFSNNDELAQRLRKVPGVTRAVPLVEGQAMASSLRSNTGALVRGHAVRVTVPLPPQPGEDVLPVAQAQDATVEQTGADPPPERWR